MKPKDCGCLSSPTYTKFDTWLFNHESLMGILFIVATVVALVEVTLVN